MIPKTVKYNEESKATQENLTKKNSSILKILILDKLALMFYTILEMVIPRTIKLYNK